METIQNFTSTKPYLLRALYEWCTDNGLTPYVAVKVDANTRVPMEFVRGGEIVLNISFDATHKLEIDNAWLSFSARFGGVAREIAIPVGNIMTIYAKETGQGMSFPVESLQDDSQQSSRSNANEVSSDSASLKSTSLLSAVPAQAKTPSHEVDSSEEGTPDDEPPRPSGRPSLKVVK